MKAIENEKMRLTERLELHFPGGIPRSKVGTATGGLIAPKTLANLASNDSGPMSYRVRGRVVYPVAPLVDWLFGDN